MQVRNISWGKGGRCVGLTTLPQSCVDYLEFWELQPPGTLRACPGLSRPVMGLLYINAYKSERASSNVSACQCLPVIYT